MKRREFVVRSAVGSVALGAGHLPFPSVNSESPAHAARAATRKILIAGGNFDTAFIRPAAGANVNREELFDYMRQHLAPHKTPRHWFAVEAMPLTGSGKIDKVSLRADFAAGKLTTEPFSR